MKGIQYFTDKDHIMAQREVFESQFMAGATPLEISKKPAVQDFLGFGAAITGSSCYNLNLMDADARREVLKKIYSKNGLNLSVARLTIGSSDYSAELYSYDDTPFDTNLEHFSIERDKAYIIPMIKEILKIKPDLFIFASPWSPPGWMKAGGTMCGGYMRSKYVDCYAEYIVKYIKAYAEEGITIRGITPQNEPEAYQFSRYPTCIWHPEIEAEFIKSLRKKLRENSMDVQIWMYDHSFTGTERVLWTLRNSENLCRDCNGIAFHYYDGAIEETLKVKREYPNLKLHFTEGGPRLYDNYDTDICKWTTMISKSIACGYSSFTGWNLMLDECGGPNIGPFFCGGLVTLDRRTNELAYSGQYKAYAHIAPHINRSSKLYAIKDAYCPETMFVYPRLRKEIVGVMIENQNKTIVLANRNDEKVQVQFKVDDRLWYAELMPDSVSTIIID